MSSGVPMNYLTLLSKQTDNDILEQDVRNKNLRGQLSNSFGNLQSNFAQNLNQNSSYNPKEDARDAMMLRREENDHNIQRDFDLGEAKRNADNTRDKDNFAFRQAATEAAATRQYDREKQSAQQAKTDMGWTR